VCFTSGSELEEKEDGIELDLDSDSDVADDDVIDAYGEDQELTQEDLPRLVESLVFESFATNEGVGPK
jgi:hypothetical protein